ncbi:MAG: T9SS type A sorting domain-containing protein [bacterium]
MSCRLSSPRAAPRIARSIARGVQAAALHATLILAIVATHGTSHADLFAVVNRGSVYRSTNDGATWTTRGFVVDPAVAAMTPGLAPGTLHLLGATGDVHRSDDAGATWTVAGNAGASDCEDIAVERDGDLIVLTRTGDLLRSQNGGASWAPVSSGGASDFTALAVGAAVAGGDSLFAVTSSGDVSVSAGGATWVVASNTGYTPIVDIAWSDGVLWALTDAGELLRSTNSAQSWSAISTASQVGMRALAKVDSTLCAITREGDVARTSIGGAPWTWSGTVNQVFVVAAAPGSPEFATGIGGPIGATPRMTLRAFPNPFTDVVHFALSGSPSETPFEVTVYDAAGRRVHALRAGTPGARAGDLAWRPGNQPAGVYFVRIQAGNFSETQPLVLIR